MFYQINDVRLHVVDEGKGNPALLFLHFYGGSSKTWAGVAAILGADYRVIRYDHRGWGQSDKPSAGYDIASLAKDTLALIAELKLDDYILVGHSMGGKIAQYIAARRPAGLRRVVLVAPSPAAATVPPPDVLEGMKQAYSSKEGIEHIVDHVFMASNLDVATRARVIADMGSHNHYSQQGWPAGAMQEDVSEGIAQIDVPVLVIAGEKDVVDTPERLQTEVVDRIPGAKMVVVSGVGHLSMVQKPQEVAQLIREFIEG